MRLYPCESWQDRTRLEISGFTHENTAPLPGSRLFSTLKPFCEKIKVAAVVSFSIL